MAWLFQAWASSGLQFQRPIETDERVLGAFQREQGDPAVDERIEKLRIARKRLIETAERFAMAGQGLQDAAAIVSGIRRTRVDLERFADQPLRVLELAQLRLHVAEQIESVEILRIETQDFPA